MVMISLLLAVSREGGRQRGRDRKEGRREEGGTEGGGGRDRKENLYSSTQILHFIISIFKLN